MLANMDLWRMLLVLAFLFTSSEGQVGRGHCEVSQDAFCSTEMCFRIFGNASTTDESSVQPSSRQKVGCVDRVVCEEQLGLRKNVCLPISELGLDGPDSLGVQYVGLVTVLKETVSPGIFCCCSGNIAACDPLGSSEESEELGSGDGESLDATEATESNTTVTSKSPESTTTEKATTTILTTTEAEENAPEQRNDEKQTGSGSWRAWDAFGNVKIGILCIFVMDFLLLATF